MADFLRPEARATLWRWRDVIVAVGIAALGMWWALRSFGPLQWIGWGLVGLGAVLVVTGIQRARFRQGHGGPGVVSIDEGRLTYFGPLTGGAVAVADIIRLDLDPVGAVKGQWIVTGPDLMELAIPVNAEGAEQLFDAFSKLPGIQTGRLIAALQNKGKRRFTVWDSPAARLS